jgi:hypothetical protein
MIRQCHALFAATQIKSPRYPFDKKQCVPQIWSARCGKKEKPLTAPLMDADGRSSDRTLFSILNELPARLGVPVLPQCVAAFHLIGVWSVARQMDGILCNEEQGRL